jgi:hypothetical protein
MTWSSRQLAAVPQLLLPLPLLPSAGLLRRNHPQLKIIAISGALEHDMLGTATVM